MADVSAGTLFGDFRGENFMYIEKVIREVIQTLESVTTEEVCFLSPEYEVWGTVNGKEPWDKLAILCKNERVTAEKPPVSVCPCTLEGELLCYLASPSKRAESVTAFARTLFLEKYVIYRHNWREMVNSKRNMLANQLAWATKSDQEIESCFRFLKCSRNVSRCAILCVQTNADPAGENSGWMLNSDIYSLLEKWEEKNLYISDEDIYGMINNQFLIFKHMSGDDREKDQKRIRALAGSFSRYINRETKGKFSLCACVGSVYKRDNELMKSYKEAQYLSSNIEYFGCEPGGCLFINDFLFEYLFSQQDAKIQNLLTEDLRTMLDESPAISETVQALVKTDNSPSLGAARIGIHRNTMLQRVQKLRSDMVMDPLYSTRDRVALDIYSLQKNKKVIWNAGIIVQQGSVLYQGMRYLSSMLYEKSGGTFQMNLHMVATSGDNRRLYAMLDAGMLDIIVGSTIPLRNYVGEKVSVLQLPFLFRSDEEADYVIRKIVLPEIAENLKDSRIRCMDIWSMGWRHITAKGSPVRSPKDLKGRRIRILDSREIRDYFQSLGAEPFQIYYNNIREALELNIIDCQDNPYENILDMEIYRYQDYVTEMKMFFSMEAMCTSEQSWLELDEWRQNLLVQCVADTRTWLGKKRKELNERAKGELIHKGLTVVYPTREEMALWNDSITSLYKNTLHKEFLFKIQREKSKFSKK